MTINFSIIGECFICLSVDLLSKSHSAQEPCGETDYKATMSHFNWINFYLSALLLCAARLAFCSLFHLNVSSAASSQETVSSKMKIHQQELDHRTRSGCRMVIAILNRKLSLWLRSTRFSGLGCVKQALVRSREVILNFSSSWMKNGGCGTTVWEFGGMTLVVTLLCLILASKHLSSWLLQPTIMCVGIARIAHKGQAGSSDIRKFNFVGEGRALYIALIMKLSLFDSMLHSSCHEIFLLSMPSHHIQQPCLAWYIAMAHLAASSWWYTSSTRRCWHSVVVAFCQVGFMAPKPPLPCWT